MTRPLLYIRFQTMVVEVPQEISPSVKREHVFGWSSCKVFICPAAKGGIKSHSPQNSAGQNFKLLRAYPSVGEGRSKYPKLMRLFPRQLLI